MPRASTRSRAASWSALSPAIEPHPQVQITLMPPEEGQSHFLVTEEESHIVLRVQLRPGSPVVWPHTHASTFSYFVVEEGELTFLLEGREHRLAAGARITVIPGLLHACRNDTDAPVIFLVAMSSVQALEACLHTLFRLAAGDIRSR